MRALKLAVVALAILAAVVPVSPRVVEDHYSRGLYPAIQTTLTPLSNVVPIALFDVAAVILLVGIVLGVRRRLRRESVARTLVGSAMTLAVIGAVVYLVFLLFWGMNYRRVPLDRKLDFNQARVTQEAARRLGDHAVRSLNATYESAQGPGTDGPTLEAAFASAQRMLGAMGSPALGVPKRSLLELYFRKAAIDGMTDPWFLEIIVNPDALRFERPFVVAHEWAHLAGYAHEAEANFVGWLACLEGSPLAQYSGWMAIYENVSASLPRPERATLAAQLDPGPRRDLDSIVARYSRSSPIVRNTARDVYDTYLRANRVTEGIASYTGVIRLIVGAGMEDGGPLKLRTGDER
jgi:hypothetical protein